MRHCTDLRRLLLEAEPEELAGRGPSPVAEHVRTCGACRSVAEGILAETAALGRHLAYLSSAPDVDAILTAAGVGGEAAFTPAKVIRFPSWRKWSALAAAAAVAGLLFLPGDAPLQAPRTITLGPPPLVEAAPGQNVAVLPTANPDITVLWFF